MTGPKCLCCITSVNKRSKVGRSYKQKLKPAGPRIALYQHQMASFYMHECVTYEKNLNIITTILSHILYYIYDSPTKFRFIPPLGFWILALTNLNFGLSPYPQEFVFFFIFSAYRKLTLNYAKAFITLYPLIASSVSPRVLLGLLPNLLDE